MARSRVKQKSNRSGLKVAYTPKPLPRQSTFRGDADAAQQFADEQRVKSERQREEIRTLPERRRRYNQNRKPGQPHWQEHRTRPYRRPN